MNRAHHRYGQGLPGEMPERDRHPDQQNERGRLDKRGDLQPTELQQFEPDVLRPGALHHAGSRSRRVLAIPTPSTSVSSPIILSAAVVSSGPATLGLPVSKGGAGSYSIRS